MKSIRAATVILSIMFSMTAFAGASNNTQHVQINHDDMNASGSMWTARSADNEYELIGCGTKQFAGQGWHGNWGFCQAADANDDYVVCFTETDKLLEVLSAVADNSWIQFSWDEDGNCTRIDMSTQSFYLPLHTTNREK